MKIHLLKRLHVKYFLYSMFNIGMHVKFFGVVVIFMDLFLYKNYISKSIIISLEK
jgi:hypothetical protein